MGVRAAHAGTALPARLLLAAALAVVLVAPAGVGAPTRAAAPALPRPVADVAFLESIEFTGHTTLSGDLKRMEIVIDIEGSERSIVADVHVPDGPGEALLDYVLDASAGFLYPNTELTARFRATLDDGTVTTGPSVSVRYQDTRYDWRDLAGDSVAVHWTEGGPAFGRRAVEIGDDAVREVSQLLGVSEDDPIDFYVYADRAAFYDVLGPGSRENVGGEAHPDIRTLFANIAPGAIDDPWVGIVIPHELTHLVFDTAVKNPYHYPPRWLNEGVAVYLSEGYTTSDRRAVESAVDDGTLMPLGALTGQFPTTEAQFRLAYSESVSAVDFLVAEYGRPAMVALVRRYADGVTDDEAFRDALGVDVAGFEAAWLTELGAEAPVPYGPVDAPAGPVPADWRGGEAPGPSASPAATSTPTATERPTGGGTGGSGDSTGLLVALLIGGLGVAGLGIWAMRRNQRGAAMAAAAAAGVTAPPPSVEPATSPVDIPAGPPVDSAPALEPTPGVEPHAAPFTERPPAATVPTNPEDGPAPGSETRP